MLRHGSLFTGIGGFDLAAFWMGWRNIFQCEIDGFCQKILKYHFPETKLYEDIKEFNAEKYRGTVDIITGGFPCQPFSQAGDRKGRQDERALFPEMVRIIREVEPKWVVAENVSGILTIENGDYFEYEVLAQLEDIGYEVQPVLISASAIGAPHRRERLWIVANSRFTYGERKTDKRKFEVPIREGFATKPKQSDSCNQLWFAPDTNSDKRCKRRMHKTKSETAKRHIGTLNARDFQCPTWGDFPTQSPICGGDDGLPNKLDGITFSKWRKESLKGYGNAIVPQVAYLIFQILQEIENA